MTSQSNKKGEARRGTAPQNEKGSNRKLELDYIDLDPTDTFVRVSEPNRVEPGTLYYVSEIPGTNEERHFTRVSRVKGDYAPTSKTNPTKVGQECTEISERPDFTYISTYAFLGEIVDRGPTMMIGDEEKSTRFIPTTRKGVDAVEIWLEKSAQIVNKPKKEEGQKALE